LFYGALLPLEIILPSPTCNQIADYNDHWQAKDKYNHAPGNDTGIGPNPIDKPAGQSEYRQPNEKCAPASARSGRVSA
jgi:hypothetical protein